MSCRLGHYHPLAESCSPTRHPSRTEPLPAPKSYPPPRDPPGPPLSRGRRLGRRIGQLAYYALVLFVGGIATLQVVRAAFFTEENAPAYGTCEEGLMALYEAVERGRQAARLPVAPSDDAPSDEAALRRYREAVAPTWRQRDHVARQCRSNPELRRALDAIERLRYSEEHNVRSQAAELGPLRRRVQRIVKERLTDAQSR